MYFEIMCDSIEIDGNKFKRGNIIKVYFLDVYINWFNEHKDLYPAMYLSPKDRIIDISIVGDILIKRTTCDFRFTFTNFGISIELSNLTRALYRGALSHITYDIEKSISLDNALEELGI